MLLIVLIIGCGHMYIWTMYYHYGVSPTLPHDQLYSITFSFFIPTGSPPVGAIVGAILVVVVVLRITAGIKAWRYCK